MTKYGADVEKRFASWIQANYPGCKILGREWAPGQWIKEPTSKGWPDFAVKMLDGTLKFYEVKQEGQDLQLNQQEMLSALGCRPTG